MDERRRRLVLHPDVYESQEAFKRALGMRPETRLDEVIFGDGTVLRELDNGVFFMVRRGPLWVTSGVVPGE